MTIAALASQFSDVDREQFSNGNVPGPPYFPTLWFASRIGQTVWCCVELTNPSAQDGYFLVKPLWAAPGIEYTQRVGPLVSPIKRLDVVGSPSPFGSSVSQMLEEIWRFFVPAGETRRHAFFFPSEGFRFALGMWFTDIAGAPVVIAVTTQRIWYALGAPHALMTEKVEQDLEAVS